MAEVPSTHLYRPSGRAPIFGLALGVMAAGAVALVSAPLYAYATVYCPVVQLSVLLSLLYGAVLGGVPALVLVRVGKVRNTSLVVLIALGASLLGWLVCWVPWVYATMNRFGDVPLFVVLNPVAFTQMIASLYELGSWSIGSSSTENVSGLFLGAIWLVEFGLVVGTGAIAGFGIGEGGPFCERCETWCKNVGLLMQLPIESEDAIVPRLLSGDVGALSGATQVPLDVRPAIQVLGFQCPSCRDTATFLVQRVNMTKDSKGNSVENRTNVVQHLMVRAADVDWARGGAQGARPAG